LQLQCKEKCNFTLDGLLLHLLFQLTKKRFLQYLFAIVSICCKLKEIGIVGKNWRKST